jgi:NADH dehydrogenase
VNKYLQLADNKEIFAIGDIAFALQSTVENETHPLPALAQVATKQAKEIAKSIKRLIDNKQLEPFSYKSLGALMSLGQWMAVGEILGVTFSGPIAWFIWRTVYLFKLISLEKKIKVAIDWTTNLFLPRDVSQF